MHRLALVASALVLITAGVTVPLVSASSGTSRPAAHPPTAVNALALPKPLVPLRAVKPQGLPKAVHPLVQPYNACYVGRPQCSLHGCAQYVAPAAQAVVAAPAVASVLPRLPTPSRSSSHCIASPARKTVPATATVITASPAQKTMPGTATFFTAPAKPVLSQSGTNP